MTLRVKEIMDVEKFRVREIMYVKEYVMRNIPFNTESEIDREMFGNSKNLKQINIIAVSMIKVTQQMITICSFRNY